MGVSQSQKLRLGLFVLVGVAVFLGGLAILAGMKLGEKRAFYPIHFSQSNVSLSGLEVGSPVKYSGLRVGRVERVGLAKDDVSIMEVTISLDEGTPVAEDSKANLGSMGITGLKYIELTRGSREARLRRPGEVIPEGTSLMDDLSGQAGDIARKVQETLDNLNALTDAEMRGQVRSILKRTDGTLAQLEGLIDENRDSVRHLSQRLAATAESVERLADRLERTADHTERLLGAARPRILRVLDHSATLLEGLSGVGGRLELALDAGTHLAQVGAETLGPKGLGQFVTDATALQARVNLTVQQLRENLVESVAFLKEATENMAVFSDKIREDPSLLLLGEGGE